MRLLPCRRASALAAMVLLTPLAGACGDDEAADGISVSDVWARPTAPSVTVGGVYMTLESATDDSLLGASVPVPVAARVTLHRTETSGGTSTMAALERLDLPVGQEVHIAPGGTHLMLEELAAPLVEGASFNLTLDFAHAADQVVTVAVRNGDT